LKLSIRTIEETIMRLFTRILAGAILTFCLADMTPAQPILPVPQPSPRASVSQTIGITKVDVFYNRPAVKGRKVWGELVPLGGVWRAGANENTTISFSTAVRVGGATIAAGTYGLHMIPANGPWTIILSTNASSWGSYFYKQSEDALRFAVTPAPEQFHEWLQFEFSAISDTGAVLSLLWENVRVPIALSFDTPALVLANARDSYLRGVAGFTWQGYNQAARYALQNGGDLTEALGWIDRSLQYGTNFTNLQTKAAILEKRGDAAGAKTLRTRAMQVATETEINAHGYTLMGAGRIDEAIAMFESNVKAHPGSWNVYDSLGEALEKKGEVKAAIKNYEKALALAGDDENKKRLTATLTRLRVRK
jgi:tetratricopeptide (TPR) repeat protein